VERDAECQDAEATKEPAGRHVGGDQWGPGRSSQVQWIIRPPKGSSNSFEFYFLDIRHIKYLFLLLSQVHLFIAGLERLELVESIERS
jgi:hypothetical protein